MRLYRLQYSDENEDRERFFLHADRRNFYLDVMLSLEKAALKAIESDCNLPLTWESMLVYVAAEIEELGYTQISTVTVDMRGATMEIPQIGESVREKIRIHNARFLLTDFST